MSLAFSQSILKDNAVQIGRDDLRLLIERILSSAERSGPKVQGAFTLASCSAVDIVSSGFTGG